MISTLHEQHVNIIITNLDYMYSGEDVQAVWAVDTKNLVVPINFFIFLFYIFLNITCTKLGVFVSYNQSQYYH